MLEPSIDIGARPNRGNTVINHIRSFLGCNIDWDRWGSWYWEILSMLGKAAYPEIYDIR